MQIKLAILLTMHKKWSFLLRISSVNVAKSVETTDLVTFIEEILNGKLHFLCSVNADKDSKIVKRSQFLKTTMK